MASGRLLGVAVAFLIWTGSYVAFCSNDNNKDETKPDLAGAKMKINEFFDNFDDVITDQAARISDGEATKNDSLNKKLLELVGVAENLEQEIYHAEDDDDDDDEDEDNEDDDGESSDSLEKMETEATSLVKEASDVLADADKQIKDTLTDRKLKAELISLKANAEDIEDALKSVKKKKNDKKKAKKNKKKGKKNKKRKNKKKNKKNQTTADTTTTPETTEATTTTEEPHTEDPTTKKQNNDRTTQADDPTPLWVDPLTGSPVTRPDRPEKLSDAWKPNPVPVQPSGVNPDPPKPKPTPPKPSKWNPNPDPSRPDTWVPEPESPLANSSQPSDPKQKQPSWNPYTNPNPTQRPIPWNPKPNATQKPDPWNPNPNPNPQPNTWNLNPNPNPNPQPNTWNPNPNPNPNPQPNTWNPNPNPNPNPWKPNPPKNSGVPWSPNPNTYTGPRPSPVKFDDGLGRSNSQYYDTNPLRNYLYGCPDCVDSTTSHQCPLNNEVLEMKKWASELQQLLSFGCEKPASCKEPGVCCIQDKYPFKQTVVQMTQMLKDVYMMFAERCKNGCKDKAQAFTQPAWSLWSDWSSCDVSCGRGMRVRKRVCNNPAPNNNQQFCPGQATEAQSCNMNECCVDGNWGPWNRWSTCSASCGQAFRERKRSCDSPMPNSCGRSCPGSPMEIDNCPVIPCCVDRMWTSWTSWGSCSASCGRGVRDRSRTCQNPSPGSPSCSNSASTCLGPSTDTESCSTGVDCCVDGNWSPWNKWSSCSATCGQAYMERSRTCDNPSPNYCGQSCTGNSMEAKDCLGLPSCCVDPTWTSWTSWTSCSASCGSGYRERSRICESPRPGAPTCGRQTCPGPARETKTCTGTQNCCIDGNWSSWNRWSPCSATCGKGVSSRKRKCDNPFPNYCGNSCPGSPREQRECGSDQSCCTDGNWSSWTPWSSCSASCGQGVVSRLRRCDNPSPNFCGQRCPGRASDNKPCNAGACCVNGNWGSWGSWAGCSVSCGRGDETRQRLCNDPPANFCGDRCFGSAVDIRKCDRGNCCVDGNWASWERWSTCSASCGTGNQIRMRRCANPPANSCGRPCPGPERDSRECNTGVACPALCVDGNWGSWNRWEGCSSSCGRGNQLRRRQCDDPPANYCGKSCPGVPVDLRYCNQGDCCVDGNWAPWEEWTGCSVSCGIGSRVRIRMCSNPPANSCGRPCPGPERESKDCNAGTCPQRCRDGNWSSWGVWSSCSDSCGNGMRGRSRTCSNPPPDRCGRTCPGDQEELVPCDRSRFNQLVVNGNWGSWERWSSCSVSCGSGVRQRRRECSNPRASACGRQCPGTSYDSEPCNQASCRPTCVDGNWGRWASWSQCSENCRQGVRTRLRQCNDPPANICGRQCPGSDSEIVTCIKADSRWSNWGAWSRCSVTCDSGFEVRSRSCDDPTPQSCSNFQCPGDPNERRRCDRSPCAAQCVDGTWSSWDRWTSCSRSCGDGLRKRARRCLNRNHCGRTCPGDGTQSERCNERPCQNCVDGNWGTWSGWSTCSASCGAGSHQRTRSCSNPPANTCGRSCPGDATEKKWCIISPCASTPAPQRCVDNTWGSWERWSQCSVSCGRGIKDRRRRCNRPAFNSCGRPCPGDDSERAACDTGVACRPQRCIDGGFSSWVAWTACSATCGRGQRTYVRTCTNPPPNDCGAPCKGPMETQRECEERPCAFGQRDGTAWTAWGSWQRCDCPSGKRSRSRECRDRVSRLKVDPRRCQGDEREEGMCDTRKVCPACINACTGKTDGIYPSCASCSQYMVCTGGQEERKVCSQGAEWDDFLKRCVPGKSPSCTIHQCVDDCRNKKDGRYHSCGRCNAYVECSGGRLAVKQCNYPTDEFNAHMGRCEGENSPTCPRAVLAPYTVPRGSRRRPSPVSPNSTGESPDAPRPQTRRRIKNCVTSCRGLKPGRYPSCRDCRHYVMCTRSNNLLERKCLHKTQWDDEQKLCIARSKTCHLR